MQNIKIIPAVAVILMLPSCSISTFEIFQADEGVKPFIQVGETTRTEFLETLGEPLVHRIGANIDPKLIQFLAQ